MRLHPEERKVEIRDAILALLIFCLPLGIGAYFIEKRFELAYTKLNAQEEQAKVVLEKNQAEIEEIRIIQGNQAEIDATWALLNSWNQGAIRQESAVSLTEAGFHSVNPIIPGAAPGQGAPRPGIPNRPQRPGIPQRQPNQGAQTLGEYTQIEGKSNQSEFLRVISAISKIEESEGLTQVQKLDLKLPQDTPPYQDKPTYLDVDLILATPNAVR